MSNEIKIELEPFGMMPKKEFKSAIGYDLFIPEDIVVESGHSVVPLNFRISLPEGYAAFIFNRSGTSAKGMKGYNIWDNDREDRFDCDVELGMVDPRYDGIVGMIVNNHGGAFKLKRGDSVAQMVIIKCETAPLIQVAHITRNNERGEQGFNA